MPSKVFWSNFPSPDIPPASRPWRPNRGLCEEDFKDEAREWDVNEIVFTQMWKTYHGIMRADFELFDQYEFKHDRGLRPGCGFDFPLTTFFGSKDRKVCRDMVGSCDIVRRSLTFQPPQGRRRRLVSFRRCSLNTSPAVASRRDRLYREVLGWERFTSGAFECVEVEGNHLFPLDKQPKLVWLQHIADRLRGL